MSKKNSIGVGRRVIFPVDGMTFMEIVAAAVAMGVPVHEADTAWEVTQHDYATFEWDDEVEYE